MNTDMLFRGTQMDERLQVRTNKARSVDASMTLARAC